MTDVPCPAAIDPADWEQTPLAVRAVVHTLLAEVQALQGQVADLTARLNQHSGNSSRPPSADPPQTPARPARPPTGRQRGGQPGHPGHHRALLPPDQVDTLHRHRPLCCPHCQTALPPDAPEAGPPQRRQIWDLPPIQAHVTEHQLLGLTCPGCAALVYADLPADVPAGSFGPQVVALVGLLHGRFRLSAREVAAILEAVFGVEMGLGSVPACCATVSAALAPCYEEVAAAVRTPGAVNVDETGWKQAGVRHWLWVAVAAVCTLYLVSRHRDRATLQALLGLVFTGVIGSDRYNAYGGRDPTLRQLCWAHLKRNLQACAERGGAVGAWATEVLGQVREVFRHWHAYQAGTLDRAGLQAALAPVQSEVRRLLEAEGAQALPQAAALSRELLAVWPALWTFVQVPGVEPTNNRAERALRPAVLWRKGCFGAVSAGGNEFVERILTVTATCQQQGRALWPLLSAAVRAYWADSPAPRLLPTP